jgi:RHS repeat-associated protein
VAGPNRDYRYFYDPSGNMTNAASPEHAYAFTYDEDNRVMSVFWDHKTAPQFTKQIANHYDAVGRRVARTIDGAETRYVLDLALGMERILCDTDGAGQITAWYVHSPAGLAYKTDTTNGLTCYHSDAQANVIALTDGTKKTVAEYAYTPYGRSLPNSTTDSNPYRYVGSQGVMEELPNFYFMRARYYSAEAAVFLSTDPVKHVGPEWRAIAHAYAEGNPVRYADPTGRSADAALKIGLSLFKCEQSRIWHGGWS